MRENDIQPRDAFSFLRPQFDYDYLSWWVTRAEQSELGVVMSFFVEPSK